jgi:2'-hydroxyisoflavone reductase
MRLLILGGTQFLGRAVAAHAVSMGHDVTCAARGVAGSVPAGSRFVHLDRNEEDAFAPLAEMEFDAVVDVARHPGFVRRAVAALRRRVGHWTFVSTVSVYSDDRTVGQRVETAPLLAPTAMDTELSTPETYGAAKVACEQAVGDGAFICRAGLIVGPEDPTGRFTYWPTRLRRGGEVLVAGTPDDPVQFIDVRDLAQWIIVAAKTGLTGTFDGIGPSVTKGQFLVECAKAVGASCRYTWVDRAFMESQDIKPWSGPRSLPMWLPLPDFAGFVTRDASMALAAGLTVRGLSETARDTFLWWRESGGPMTGLTADDESAALKVWHARS